MTPVEREQLEADCTFRRVVELELYPVRGNFDAAHLKEVNRRIFQDLPALGFHDVRPGQFRAPVPAGRDWLKNRVLGNREGSYFVAYSAMDTAAQDRLEKVLARANPSQLQGLKTATFTERLAELYAELDYIHPFSDGNSRTLRTFTRQLAMESGYELAWERFSGSPDGRDCLYVARDSSVNTLAKPFLQSEFAMRKLISTQGHLAGYRALPDLLRDVIQPGRAVAFEQLQEADALAEHPELAVAYKTMQAAAAYFESKMPGMPKEQNAGLLAVRQHIQAMLNAGETRDFQQGREAGNFE